MAKNKYGHGSEKRGVSRVQARNERMYAMFERAREQGHTTLNSAVAAKPVFYLCEICGAHHSWEWNGDCREDGARYTYESLDARYGADNWEERDMTERVAADLGEG